MLSSAGVEEIRNIPEAKLKTDIPGPKGEPGMSVYFNKRRPFRITKMVLPSCPTTPRGRSIT